MQHPQEHVQRLAAIAHEFWRARMTADGWKHGASFDAGTRTHDALAPFDRLSPDDQREAIACLLSVDAPDLLARSIRYDRGPERAFSLSEMKPGLRVAWAPHVVRDDPVLAAATIGEIMDWRVDPRTEELGVFRVRWDTGSITEHEPLVKDLRRME